jgi:hypothetical protein
MHFPIISCPVCCPAAAFHPLAWILGLTPAGQRGVRLQEDVVCPWLGTDRIMRKSAGAPVSLWSWSRAGHLSWGHNALRCPIVTCQRGRQAGADGIHLSLHQDRTIELSQGATGGEAGRTATSHSHQGSPSQNRAQASVFLVVRSS